eukprot:TRINITY_DN182161_c0_g1_i1.p2 TRINITY_DN182161_c0_g1~~TRINITY_DN182161_c0_g1_i1.p2  ORF type:complete len:142 (-),score=2.91 TRINITY_DN182161_c0_g1_i1:33-458(-)
MVYSVQLCNLTRGLDTKQKQIGNTVKKLYDLHGYVPIIILSDSHELPEELDPRVRHMVVAQLPLPLSYNDLNDAIHRAQRYNEAQEQRNEQSGRRPSHLFRSLVGTSRLIKGVRTMMTQVADKDVIHVAVDDKTPCTFMNT